MLINQWILVQVSGDMITVDAEKLQLTVDLSDAELKSRKDAWKQPPLPALWIAWRLPSKNPSMICHGNHVSILMSA
jgi:dihydroxyacid dehydratase/phosphogluconate dehydratase